MGITGFDQVTKELKQLEKAMSALNGTITNISFDPEDSKSVNTAIREMDRAVDRKVLPYRSNPFVGNIVKQAKAHFKNEILNKAKEAKRQTRH